jgi:hypothetical protein
MDYADFETEYQKVVHLLRGDRAGLPAAINRLRQLATTIEDEDDREEAGWDIVALEDSIEKGKREPEEPPSEVILQARRIYAEANRDGGTVAERLARAEEGVRALERLEVATPEEEQAIGALEHTLMMLIGALRLMR